MMVLAMVFLAVLATTAAATVLPGFDIQRVTDNAYMDQEVRVSGDRLVWSGSDGADWEIFTWKVGDAAPTQVSSNDGIQDSFPDVSGDRIRLAGFNRSGVDLEGGRHRTHAAHERRVSGCEPSGLG